MPRREFPKKVKVEVIRRSTRGGVVYCEKCGLPCKKWQIDHVIPDSIGGHPVIENAELICEICYDTKNRHDTKVAAKVKRVEAKSLGVKKPATLKSAGFAKSAKAERPKLTKVLPPRPMFTGDDNVEK